MSSIHRTALTACAVAAFLALTASTALGVHWPFFGGDNGRSGYQPVGEGRAPVEFLYSKTAPNDQFVKTSPITTTGTPATMRVVYGTVRPGETTADANGRVHLRLLGSGEAVGGEAGVKIDDGAADADVFGPPASAETPASVSFADTSGPTGLGHVFAVHNDDDQAANRDIAIAQVDEADGTLVQDVAVQGTNGFTIASSPVMTGPDPQGDRTLFFVAFNGNDERLFRVPVANADARNAAIGAASDSGDIDADPQASPTLVFLNDANGTRTAYIAVGTSSATSVRTFRVSDLAAGPATGDLAGSAQTPSVPITSSGMTPGASGSGTAPFIYVAIAKADGTTVVQKLRQSGNSQSFEAVATSGPYAGSPAPALALDQEVEASGVPEGRVVLTTSRNLFVLKTADLTQSGRFDVESDLVPGTTGFGQTTAAASGDLAYVTNDEGAQFVIDLATGKPVPGEAFTENGGNGGDRLDKSGMGQPSIARGLIQFGSQKGLFVYRNRCGNAVSGTDAADRVAGTLAGDAIGGAKGDDVLDGGLAGDCPSGAEGRDTLAGGSGADSLSGGAGVDTLSGGPGNDSLKGGDDRDFITGDSGRDTIDGEAGSNVIDGGLGADVIQGGPLVDSLNGGPDGDLISGGAGNDGVTGASGDDTLLGGDGNDRIEGGLGKDSIRGGRGNDNIVSIDGQFDVVVCNSGRDTVRADGGDRVSKDCEVVIERAGDFGEADDDRDTDSRNLDGFGGNELAGSGAGDQELRGGAGNDTIDSPLGGDRLFGLAGMDVLASGSGDDRAEGGAGSDVVSGGPGRDTLFGGEARDYMEGGPGNDVLQGEQGSNIMNGAQGNDTLTGGPLSDSMNGGSDEDTLRGGDGNDGITGASGRDRLFGEGGNDRIEGGLGRDEIDGGDGGDNIVAADGQVDTIRCGAGRDTVRADGEDRIARDCELVIARRGDAYVVVRR